MGGKRERREHRNFKIREMLKNGKGEREKRRGEERIEVETRQPGREEGKK